MTLTRRRLIGAGAGLFAGCLFRPRVGMAGGIVDIVMQGTADGSHVWFDPAGVHIPVGGTIRWTNRDAGNSHTVTSYHPAIGRRPLRIPAAAKPWDSDYLLPGETFSVTLTEAGVYDYYCVPHEHAGMVGRIVVGTPPPEEETRGQPDNSLTPLPEAALNGFVPVADIVAKGSVHLSRGS